ncbi:MAG: hypothetical protein LBQ66_08390 [Planctomycetaceae bacterium]|jgi:hypothetical protein|nr:hypothetical protein [Planctomycetaceae bacterium]
MTEVFITVKTYPTLSKKYDELVCTAGITDEGNWIRIYPVPFRKLDFDNKYVKYQWLSIPLIRNVEDFRPESYRIENFNAITQKEKIKDWDMRRQIILGKTPIYTNMNTLIEKAKNKELSLATFKPQKITDFIVEATERNWPKDKLELLKAKSQQLSFFQTIDEIKREFSVVNKVPYKFSYQFTDDTGKTRTLMIEGWEIGMLYWNCLKATNNDEKSAIEKIRQKYFGEFLEKDIFLFLGTTKAWHNVAPDPFVIIGIFVPPRQYHKLLF